VVDDGDLELVNFLRREIAEQGTNFINSATSLLNRSQIKRSTKTGEIIESGSPWGDGFIIFKKNHRTMTKQSGLYPHGRRKNLRRQTRKDRQRRNPSNRRSNQWRAIN